MCTLCVPCAALTITSKGSVPWKSPGGPPRWKPPPACWPALPFTPACTWHGGSVAAPVHGRIVVMMHSNCWGKARAQGFKCSRVRPLRMHRTACVSAGQRAPAGTEGAHTLIAPEGIEGNPYVNSQSSTEHCTHPRGEGLCRTSYARAHALNLSGSPPYVPMHCQLSCTAHRGGLPYQDGAAVPGACKRTLSPFPSQSSARQGPSRGPRRTTCGTRHCQLFPLPRRRPRDGTRHAHFVAVIF